MYKYIKNGIVIEDDLSLDNELGYELKLIQLLLKARHISSQLLFLHPMLRTNFYKMHKSLSVLPAIQANLTKQVMSIEDIPSLVPFQAPQKRGTYKRTVIKADWSFQSVFSFLLLRTRRPYHSLVQFGLYQTTIPKQRLLQCFCLPGRFFYPVAYQSILSW